MPPLRQFQHPHSSETPPLPTLTCRSCNRAFPTPSVRESWFVKSNAKDYVFARDIPRLERRARRRRSGSRGRPRNNYKAALFLGIILVVLAAAGWWWLAYGSDSESGEIDFPRHGLTGTQTVLPMPQNKEESDGSLVERVVDPPQTTLLGDSERDSDNSPVSTPTANITPA